MVSEAEWPGRVQWLMNRHGTSLPIAASIIENPHCHVEFWIAGNEATSSDYCLLFPAFLLLVLVCHKLILIEVWS